jgi:hypothetical protein
MNIEKIVNYAQLYLMGKIKIDEVAKLMANEQRLFFKCLIYKQNK